MKPSNIQYDPYLSLEEIAHNSGVSVEAVRRYIKSREIDRKADEQLIKYKEVKKYLYEHKDATYPELAQALRMSISTARKYGEMKHPPRPTPGKISVVREMQNTLYVSVSASQSDILRAILSHYLDGALTYDCDLTTAKGSFYHHSVPLPRFLYDIAPQMEGVKHLDEAVNMPNEVFRSVVIDLPYSVATTKRRDRKQSFNNFASIEELYTTYQRMISLAWRLLKPDGILVFKTSDFSLAGKPMWISDWSISTAIQIGFSLADKYIYIDQKAVNAVTSSRRKANVPAHAYFLVFHKTGEKCFWISRT